MNDLNTTCKHFGICGGCSLQHLAASVQVQEKQNNLLALLEQHNIAAKQVLIPLTSNSWGYRNKARIGVKYVHKKSKVLLGFREKSGRFVLDMEHCPVLHPNFDKLIPAIQQCLNRVTCYDTIPQLEIAVGDGQLAIIVRHLEPLAAVDQQLFYNLAQTHNIHLYLQPKGPKTIHRIWPEGGQERLCYQLEQYNLEMLFHPSDFIQVNHSINQLMLAQAIKLLDINSQDKILDLFCGIGNFTLPMATLAAQVTGVEIMPQSVARAKENAVHNNINNVEFIAADLFKPEMCSGIFAAKASETASKILLDPPRSGAKEILPNIAAMQPEKILYVSCNPITLARDLDILVNNYGYDLSHIGIMDMFPHTEHIESMALLSKE